MTTDRDTLREKEQVEVVLALGYLKFEAPDVYLRVIDDVLKLIDAHDNALKEQTEADILGLLPASSRTCTCTTCRVVTGKLNQVFSKGETDE